MQTKIKRQNSSSWRPLHHFFVHTLSLKNKEPLVNSTFILVISLKENYLHQTSNRGKPLHSKKNQRTLNEGAARAWRNFLSTSRTFTFLLGGACCLYFFATFCVLFVLISSNRKKKKKNGAMLII